LHERRVAAGAHRVGLKIGFTNTAVWDALGLADPICVPVYDDTVIDRDVLPPREFDLTPLVAPAIEPEIALGIARDGVSWWALAFEIVQCHYPGWRMTAPDALADYALHGGLVVGPRHPGDPASFAIELLRNGELVERGSTEAVLGGPLHALARLTEIVAATPSITPLRPGEIVTTGTMTAAPRVASGESWQLHVASPDVEPLTLELR
jgi:2-oxo-3-hexenedioate decarboxylase